MLYTKTANVCIDGRNVLQKRLVRMTGFIMTIVLCREKMMQLLIWIRYNRITKVFYIDLCVCPLKMPC